MSISHSSTKTRQRHVPVRNAQHVYWSETRQGKRYEVRYPRNGNGQRLFETLRVGATLDDAKARAREVYGNTGVAVISTGTTLTTVVASWREMRNIRPRSVETFDRVLDLHILPKLGHRKVRDINRQIIEAWLNGLKRVDGKDGALSNGTRRMHYAILCLVLQHAVEMGALSSVPTLSRKRKPRQGESRRRILTADEERNMLAYSAAFPWLRPIVTVALHQALRLGEVCGLEWSDVDFAGKRLYVRHSLGRDGSFGPPKGGKAVSIPLTPKAREALLDLFESANGPGLVFRNTLGGPRQLRDVQRAFDKARARAGLDVEHEDGPVCFHSLRHTGISRLANSPDVPLVGVRDFARHSSLTVTNGYCHAIESAEVTDAMARALEGATS